MGGFPAEIDAKKAVLRPGRSVVERMGTGEGLQAVADQVESRMGPEVKQIESLLEVEPTAVHLIGLVVELVEFDRTAPLRAADLAADPEDFVHTGLQLVAGLVGTETALQPAVGFAEGLVEFEIALRQVVELVGHLEEIDTAVVEEVVEFEIALAQAADRPETLGGFETALVGEEFVHIGLLLADLAQIEHLPAEAPEDLGGFVRIVQVLGQVDLAEQLVEVVRTAGAAQGKLPDLESWGLERTVVGDVTRGTETGRIWHWQLLAVAVVVVKIEVLKGTELN